MATNEYDLLILTDATASMGSYLRALNASLPEIIRISALTDCFARIGVVAYRDYCGGELTEWSGWYSNSDSVKDAITQDALLAFVQKLKPDYGGDWPEATKTGLARAYQVMREDATTLMLLYTDAPPHMPCTKGENRMKEVANLSRKDSFGSYGPLFVDWVSAARALQSGKKRAIVYSVVHSHLIDTLSPYIYLGKLTGGACFQLAEESSITISNITMGLLLGWMGVGKGGVVTKRMLGHIRQYKNTDTIEKIQNEDDNIMETYFLKKDAKPFENAVRNNVGSEEVSLDNLKDHITPRNPPLEDFSKNYVANPKYRQLIIGHLRNIIQADVKAMTVNPVFGSLWRTVCNDRDNEARDELIQAFGRQVDSLADAEQKARMKTWLEESYNYAADILQIIESVPATEKYPCVFLDPTQNFEPVPGASDDEVDNRPLNKFTRDELLEIGRSCDYRILRRLGKVLTRLTYINSEEELPAHIKKMSEEEVPRIPMALADHKYKAKFWKILLHVVLPGTMLSLRPAAVLAALSLRMGMLPLRNVADAELLSYRSKWNSLEIPETWNVSCLALLLDADKDFEKRVQEGVTQRPTGTASSLLLDEDRKLFGTLVEYKMLELNLNTTLRAKIGWSPEKAKVAVGPVVVCKTCKYPRSVTGMSTNGLCGHCSVTECSCEACVKSEDHEARLRNNVSTNDNEKTEATWVECFSSACRGQYVVYNPDKLNVRPKCFYCRHSNSAVKMGPAPLVDCSQCLNRIIWPAEYRPANFDAAAFKCFACAVNKVTIIDHETTPQELRGENGTTWLLRNEDNNIAEPFNGRSLFYTASNVKDLTTLSTTVEILPLSENVLTIRGKLVQNLPEVHEALRGWVRARRTEAGVCSLCFSDLRKADLRLACGRSGCHQKICSGCLKDWYGLNSRGRVINVAALSCPFCRRQPAAKTVSGLGVAQLGGLRDAVADAGSWVYAWCSDCGFAKQFVERACAAGPPPELENWRCEECLAKKGKKAVAVKECPECGTATEKVGGCDHITCPVCHSHWCFFCGENVGADKIYSHMSELHGGWWAGRDEEEDDEEEYED